MFNHKVPDRDTGQLRQTDVWINARLAGCYPLSVLISCKDHDRPLSITQIETFLSEIRSTCAHLGVIYSSRGFSKQAIAKARANAISCCRLYRNEPAEMPERLILSSSFVCSSVFRRITILEEHGCPPLRVWSDLFDLTVDDNGTERSVISVLSAEFKRTEELAARQAAEHRRFPQPWGFELTCSSSCDNGLHLRVAVGGYWKVHKGRLEANLLNGSYCLNDGSFVGAQVCPYIDTQSADPGPGWELLTEPPPEKLPDNSVIIIRQGADFEKNARDGLGMTPIPGITSCVIP